MRSARGMFAIVFRAVSLELRSVHDHLAWWGRQYFVDTAEDEFVARHVGRGVGFRIMRRPPALFGHQDVAEAHIALLPARLDAQDRVPRQRPDLPGDRTGGRDP